MKKNKALTAAISVLSLTMVSLCAIGGTFAKYTTNGNATDTAKVAKWGVVVTAETYADDRLEADLSTTENAIIASGSAPDLLAPGTGIKFASVDVTGTPEVEVEVKYSAVLTLSNFGVDGDDQYCPLVFVVNSTEYKMEGEINTIAKLETAVEGAISAYSEGYIAGTNLGTEGAGKLTVSCYWAFDGNDTKDTALGNKAADDDPDNDPSVELQITCTVNQLD